MAKASPKTRTPKHLFESKDYLSFLVAYFERQSESGRGIKAEFARRAGCSTAYLSHILNGKAHLTPELALSGAAMLGLTEIEERYFFYLVLRDRAGTPELRANFEAELQRLKSQATNIAERFDLKQKPAPEIEARYYSQWFYSAVRVCLYIPTLRDPRKLASALGLRADTLRKVLDFLKNSNLIKDTPQGLMPTDVNFHLDAEAPSIQKHHSHWRLRALQSLEQKQADELHYTSLISVSNADSEVVREILMKAIQDIRQVVGRSAPEESVHCYVIDCFPIARA